MFCQNSIGSRVEPPWPSPNQSFASCFAEYCAILIGKMVCIQAVPLPGRSCILFNLQLSRLEAIWRSGHAWRSGQHHHELGSAICCISCFTKFGGSTSWSSCQCSNAMAYHHAAWCMDDLALQKYLQAHFMHASALQRADKQMTARPNCIERILCSCTRRGM